MKPTSYAVQSQPAKRKEQNKFGGADWTLYRPEKVAESLGLPLEAVDAALEQSGFYKAVRIREEVLLWKERVRLEERDLQARLKELDKERYQIRQRLSATREQLVNLRNVLRLPRGKEQP